MDQRPDEQPATAKGSLQLNLTHVPDGRYKVSVYQVGYKQNDAYTAYLQMGSPNQLTREQVKSLNALSTGSPTSETETTIKGGQFTTTMPLRTNDIFVLILTPTKGHK